MRQEPLPVGVGKGSLDLCGEALVYGLSCRKRARLLVEGLVEVPACPRLIFYIGRLGRGKRAPTLLGVEDSISERLVFVQVHRWCAGGLVMGWSLDPKVYGRGVGQRAIKARSAFASALGCRPMVVRFDASAHAEAHARRLRSVL